MLLFLLLLLFYYLGQQKLNLPQVFVKLYQIIPLGSGFIFCQYYTVKQDGVFWRLAWQHPWESELAATRSSFKTFPFLKVLGVLGLRLLAPISRYLIIGCLLSLTKK